MTNYERGRQYEYKTMRFYEAMGYVCTRTAGSHGPWDVVCVSGGSIVLAQVKFGCDPTSSERESLAMLPVPATTQKVIVRWDYRKTLPRVTTL